MKVSQSAEANLLTMQKWSNIHDSINDRIEEHISRPVLTSLIAVTSLDAVIGFIEYELIILAQLVSVSGNLTNAMIPFIAKELVNVFPNENLADFKICFSRGARGDYNGDKFFRLDGIVIRDWMHKYLEQKAIARESLWTNFRKRKKDLESVEMEPAKKEVANRYLNEMLEQLKPELKKVPEISEKDIQEEGKQMPKRASKTGYTAEEWALIQKINSIRYEVYMKSGVVVSDCKVFGVNGLNVLARTQQDADEFYQIALTINP